MTTTLNQEQVAKARRMIDTHLRGETRSVFHEVIDKVIILTKDRDALLELDKVREELMTLRNQRIEGLERHVANDTEFLKDLERDEDKVRAAEEAYHGLQTSHLELLSVCRLALTAFEGNHAIDWNVLQTAIDNAGGK